jgi:PAS domain S-box-containing protein
LAEQALASNPRARDVFSLLANFPGMAYRCVGNLDAAMQFVSEGAQALCGYQGADLLAGAPAWVDLIYSADRARVQQERQQAIDAGQHFELQYRIVSQAGDLIWVSERGGITRTKDRGVVVEGFISNINERVTSQEQLQLQQEQMSHVDRLSILGEMMAGVAHEINQPLTAVSTYAQSALRFLDPENPRPERLSEALTKMISEIRRAGAVVQRIRDFASERVGENEQINCNELIAEAKSLADAQARMRGITLHLRPAPQPIYVWGERIALLQVLLNLLRNAMEAMRGDSDDAQIELSVEPDRDNSVKIEVIDSGAGVGDVEPDELFRPFTTIKQERLGLGLTTSRAIVTSHGGQLGYRNNENNGATFYLILPVSSRQASGLRQPRPTDEN